MYAYAEDSDSSDDEELAPKVHYSVILQEEDYEDEDSPRESDPRPWDPSESPNFFRIQY